MVCNRMSAGHGRAGHEEFVLVSSLRRVAAAMRMIGTIAGLTVLVMVWRPASAAAQTAQTPPQTPPAQSPSTQNPPPADRPAFKVEVIETTPLPGLDLKLEQIPAPVQTAVGADIEASGALDLSDFLNRRFNGVFVNEMQNNPFQPDLNYRGYTASPLLGTPQGLSIYMDGVRLNQPFGDVVSWDLIPRMAIGSTTLMPGSNPLFGLNTLGGALSIQTKDGRTSPGTTVRAIYGSDARRAVEFEHGGSRAERLQLVRGGQSLRRRRLAGRFAIERWAAVRQAWLAPDEG